VHVQAARNIREAAFGLGISGQRVAQMLHSILAAPEQTRRELAGECCRSAKVFQSAWVAYTRQADDTPVALVSVSVIGDV
jgi:hypothetical protein